MRLFALNVHRQRMKIRRDQSSASSARQDILLRTVKASIALFAFQVHIQEGKLLNVLFAQQDTPQMPAMLHHVKDASPGNLMMVFSQQSIYFVKYAPMDTLKLSPEQSAVYAAAVVSNVSTAKNSCAQAGATNPSVTGRSALLALMGGFRPSWEACPAHLAKLGTIQENWELLVNFVSLANLPLHRCQKCATTVQMALLQ